MKLSIIAVVVIVLLLLLVKVDNMTWRQSILKAVYPALMKADELMGKKSRVLSNEKMVSPPVSFYSLTATTTDGQPVNFSQFSGKKVLLVNTASDCGYTAQFEELEKLHQLYKDKLVVIGFPANDFKQQEKKSDKEIAAFCKKNFGVTFLLMQKQQVKKGDQQQPVYQWLTNKKQNGWNDTPPSWNFCKYLVNEKGMLEYFFGTAVSPLSATIRDKL
jgi:glutathione peroxidase